MRLFVLALVALLLAATAAGCGDDERSSDDDARSATAAANDTPDDASDDDAAPASPIRVETPKSFASVHGSFELSGTAQAHEGELRWAILDAALEPMTSGSMTASCGAPCVGTFATTVDVSKVPIGSWELHVWQPPVADSDPERVHDTIVPITVTAKPVDPDDPAADAPPPGGVPE